jgi:hypothetical protein
VQADFATATMARIYLGQGKLDEAEAVYRKLLGDRPGDPALQEGLAEVQRRREELEAGPEPDAADRVALRLQGGELTCTWSVSDEGRRRAALLLGTEGTLTLRLMTFPLEPDDPPEDIVLDRPEGQMALELPGRGLLAAAAVGLGADDGEPFAAIAHCDPVTLPPQGQGVGR